MSVNPPTPVLIAAGGAAAVAVIVLARRGRKRRREAAAQGKQEGKEEKNGFKWVVVMDRRGLVVESRGSVDVAMAAYLIQAARVLEEAGELRELVARIGDVEASVKPREDGLYRVMVR